jgi:hypothetical protein
MIKGKMISGIKNAAARAILLKMFLNILFFIVGQSIVFLI